MTRGCITAEEAEYVVWARKGGRAGLRERPAVWRIAKRGTIFTSKPKDHSLNIYKDVTHLYRKRKNGKKKGRMEWATTLWVEGDSIQTLRTSREVSEY